MKKSELIEHINNIPAEKLNAAVYAIINSNPMNAITRNRAGYTAYGSTITAVSFASRATMENIVNVYHAILDEIIIHYGIEAAHEIDWGYTPEWAREAENKEETETMTTETAQEKTDRENREHCKRIAEELEAYADGTVYRCPECGEVIRWDNEQYNDDKGTYTCDCCGTSFDESDLESLSILDFIQDAYDIEYRVGSDREYRSVKIMVACGGPNIYIDTARRLVTLRWWTDYAECPISSTACDALDEYMEEYWGCM